MGNNIHEGTSGFSFQISDSGYPFIAECTEIKFYITVWNNFSEPVDVNVYFLNSQNHLEFIDPSDFSQPDPDASKLKLPITIGANSFIQRTVKAIIRIPPTYQYFPCYEQGNLRIRGYVALAADPEDLALAYDQYDIVPEQVCLLDGTQEPVLLSEFSPPNFDLDGFIVKGEFIVDDLLSYTHISSTKRGFFMTQPGSAIQIAPEGKLELTKVDVSGCTHMWKGIRVEGELSLDQSTISDAEFAVEAYDQSALSIKSTRFVNNFTGLHIPEPKGSDFNQISLDAFWSNEFSTDETSIKPPYDGQEDLIEGDRGFAGVWIHKMPDVNLGTHSMISNTFKYLANGIISIQSNLSVHFSTFEDIVYLPGASYPYSGRGIYSYSDLFNGLGHLNQKGRGGSSSNDPSFKNCTYGIYVDGTSASIEKNMMEDVDYGVEVRNCLYKGVWIDDNWIEAKIRGVSGYQNFKSGISVTDNRFTMHDPQASTPGATGVYVDNPGSPDGYGWYIGHNTIWLMKALQGIKITSGYYSSVKNNSIYMDVLQQGQERYTGISLEGAHASALDCNEIAGNAFGANYKQATGIYLLGSPGTKASCNLIDDTRYGLQAYGMCDGSQMKGNELGNHWNGLLMGHYLGGSSYDGDAFLGPQSHHGNLWPQLQAQGANQADDRFGAVHLSDNQIIVNYSKFWVDEDEDSALMPEVGLLGMDPKTWFESEDAMSQTYTCPSENTCPEGIGADFQITGLDDRIARWQLQTEKFNAAQQWTASRHLYRRLMTDPGLVVAYTAIDTFYAEVGQTSAGLHEELHRDKAALFVLDSAETDLIDSLRASISDGLTAIAILDSLLADEPSYQDSLAYAAERADWRQQLLEISSVQDSLFQEWAPDWKQAALDLQTAAGNLPDTAQHEENHRIVAELLLDKLAEGRIQFDSTEVAALTAIASQCPLSGGDAVFEARALLGLDGFDDADLCNYSQSAAGRAEETVIKPDALKVVPNPATGAFTLVFPEAFEEGVAARILIADQMGRTVMNRILPAPLQTMEIQAAAWPSGLYSCSLVLDTGKVFFATVLLQNN